MVIIKNTKIILMIILILNLPNCSSRLGQNPIQSFLEIPKDIVLQESTIEGKYSFDVSRLYDIFIPEVNTITDLSNRTHDRKIIVAFNVKTTLEDIIAEYRTEMAYLGWEELAIFDDSDEQCCLLFSRPSRLCNVLIRRNKNGFGITLFIGPKKLVSEA